MKKRYWVIASWLLISVSCEKNNSDSEENQEATKPNILLIIADDMGLDACPGYDIGDIKPAMPNLKDLMDNGIRFTNLWSNPTCSPTRSTILTGKYGFRTGVKKVGDYLLVEETSIQTLINQETENQYANAVIGKWHLGNEDDHPNQMGIDYYAGYLKGALESYWDWDLTINGETSTCTDYNTSKYTDLAIDWIEDQTKPWFLWLAYNAPHDPFHLPSVDLHSQGNLPTDQTSIDADPLPYYLAALEAMDTEMGRLINSLSNEEKENTLIIFIGDNGTPNDVAQEYNSRRVKGSVYQGGVNVPMIISGVGVNRMNETEHALINCTDIFATIAELATTGTTEINDSKSFKAMLSQTGIEIRDFAYSEIELSSGLDNITLRNSTYKYIEFGNGDEALYNLLSNEFENPNLLSDNQPDLSDDELMILEELKQELSDIKQ